MTERTQKAKKVFYNKLIRDAIPEKIKQKGAHYDVREVKDDGEYIQELLKKVAEEATALSKTRSREEFLDEYADLHVVLDVLTRELELSEADIKTALEENLSSKGGFKKRYFLNWSSDDGYKSNETPQGIN